MLFVRQNILVSRKEERKWHSALIMDVTESELLISIPGLNGEPVQAGEGDALEITFSNEGVRYLFESEYYKKIGEAIAIGQPRLLETVDLRRYPRVPVHMKLQFAEISGRDDVQSEYRDGLIMDISGNGMRLAVDQLYTPGSYISAKFDLRLGEKVIPINMECRVVRIIVDDSKEPVEYQLGAEFSRVDKKDQEVIIDFVDNRLDEKQAVL